MYTDGGFRTKNREVSIGASASIIYRDGEIIDTVTSGVYDTTNQQTELLAVIIGLDSLYPTEEPVKVYSDSAYIVNGFKQRWFDNWRANGWRAKSGKPVKNQELWKTLLNYVESMDVEFIKVKGHSDVVGNIEADSMVNKVMDRMEMEYQNIDTTDVGNYR